jgi:hypothetical protein
VKEKISRLVAHIHENDVEITDLSDEFFYSGLSLCVIDAVYSIGARYEGVCNVVDRYCSNFEVDKISKDRKSGKLPEIERQESIDALLRHYEEKTKKGMRDDVFNNRQRTSSRNGISKAAAIRRFATVLSEHGVNHFQDVEKGMQCKCLADEIRKIPGQRSGISLSYFWMLAGSSKSVKPDRMLLRFIERALGEATETEEAAELIRGVAAELKIEPRKLDYAIWRYERARP